MYTPPFLLRQLRRVGVLFSSLPQAKYTCPQQDGQEGDESGKGGGPGSGSQEGDEGQSDEGREEEVSARCRNNLRGSYRDSKHFNISLGVARWNECVLDTLYSTHDVHIQ